MLSHVMTKVKPSFMTSSCGGTMADAFGRDSTNCARTRPIETESILTSHGEIPILWMEALRTPRSPSPCLSHAELYVQGDD
mmetsp:Transcript_12169/g.18163  ORF Transcript_12169/g.18163 Transcript_12169/m.18163 type:complete len:81 (+) Transcript_12169:332-574(+)